MSQLNDVAPEIMTVKDVSSLLRVHRSTVHNMRERGQLVGYKFGKRVYFRRSEVIAAITANPVPVKSVSATADDIKQAA